MGYTDLREWIDQVDKLGELSRIDGADWDLEIGALTEVAARGREASAILFDRIKDYPTGRRVLVGMIESLKRAALTTNLPTDITRDGFIAAWKKRLNNPALIPPRFVDSGPVMENVFTGRDIDVLTLPVPRWHDRDGGRYIGTAHVVITQDPDEGWINMGVYRVMVHDRDHLALYISPGKHARIHRQKNFDRGKPLKVVIAFGEDPLLFLLAARALPWGSQELDYAGGVKGAPIDVIRGEFTGLPIPAAAEVAIEGEVSAEEMKEEGPFGEWTGYYASGERKEPVLKIQSFMHRNDPIITGAPPFRPQAGADNCPALLRAAFIWDSMEKAGVPDVTGVACHQNRFFTAISIKQRYPGHAKQAAIIASQCQTGAYLGRYSIVVDDDIDVADINDVLWAVCTRVDPEKSIDIIRRCWSGPLDPIIPRADKGFSSRAIIDACRPFEWMKDFPAVSGASKELKDKVMEKYGAALKK
ncbi:MAG TPA: UbiD family decarboxylase [Verrucomicrobiae bacterium]|nr:UbiD family decarboxylase [Verrucomicrobiae bacterium]